VGAYSSTHRTQNSGVAFTSGMCSRMPAYVLSDNVAYVLPVCYTRCMAYCPCFRVGVLPTPPPPSLSSPLPPHFKGVCKAPTMTRAIAGPERAHQPRPAPRHHLPQRRRRQPPLPPLVRMRAAAAAAAEWMGAAGAGPTWRDGARGPRWAGSATRRVRVCAPPRGPPRRHRGLASHPTGRSRSRRPHVRSMKLPSSFLHLPTLSDSHLAPHIVGRTHARGPSQTAVA